MTDIRNQATHQSQRGVATLTFSLIILVLATSVTLYSVNFARQSISISNNSLRDKQAFDVAEAGMALAIEYIREDSDRDDDGTLDPVFDTNADGIGDSTSAQVGGGWVEVTVSQPTGLHVHVSSTGYSDDRTATRTIEQFMVVIDPLPNDPSNPLISRGSVVVNGSATVHNQEGFSTIWSGDEVDLGSNNSTATNVPDMGNAAYPNCMDTPLTCSTVASSNKVNIGLDVVENDTSIGNLTPNELFENFFGMSPEAYKETVASDNIIDPKDANTEVQLAGGEVLWVDGDTDFSANTTVGCSEVVTGGKLCGTDVAEPSILIIDGDVTFKGTPNFTGIVFIMGDAEIGGTMTVQGSIVIAGTATQAGGSMDVWFNSQVLSNIQSSSAKAGSAGTWKDF